MACCHGAGLLTNSDALELHTCPFDGDEALGRSRLALVEPGLPRLNGRKERRALLGLQRRGGRFPGRLQRRLQDAMLAKGRAVGHHRAQCTCNIRP